MLATPMLAVTKTSPWLSASGSRKMASIRSASAIAAPGDFAVASSTTYSSPDRRATIVPCGTALTSLRATVTSTSSPAAWPRESLMFLNRSRSTKNSVGCWSWVQELPSKSLMHSSSTVRLGRPVSGSVCAPCRSAACALLLARTAITTRIVTTVARTNADSDLTILSAVSLGAVPASTMIGKTSEEVVTMSRPIINRLAGAEMRPTVAMLG